MKTLFAYVFLLLVASSCAVSKTFNISKKYSPEELQSDYQVFREVLEETHPSLYWYTPKDSLDYYFAFGEKMLADSLTEPGYRKVLSYVASKIRCGHTSVKPSKPYEKYTRRSSRFFPLSLKLWPDTAVVTLNLSKKDSQITKGAIIKSIDQKPMHAVVDTLFQFLTADGYNLTHKYQALSNRGAFGSAYTSVFGWKERYLVNYIDTLGNSRSSYVSLYRLSKDSVKKTAPQKISSRERKRQRYLMSRSLQFDTLLNTAVMDLSTFTKGYDLRHFFKTSFKKIRKQNVQNLILDLRSNGGGSVGNSTLLTKYIANRRFKIADSLYAVKRSHFSSHMQNRFPIWLFLQFMTRHKKDGYYHFAYFEGRKFKPRNRNRFRGTVFVLTGGNTFSASTLFLESVAHQQNVVVVGEETGGGAYGNSAWVIPDVTLPITGIRFRLPLFRLVANKNVPKNGRGILPEVTAEPTVKDIRRNADFKMEKAVELIKRSEQKNANRW